LEPEPHKNVNLQRSMQYTNMLGYYAGFISRLVAFFIDIVILGFTLIIAAWMISLVRNIIYLDPLINLVKNQFNSFSQMFSWLNWNTISLLSSGFYIIGYYVFFWYFTGQTPGKALLGLRVITTDGRRVSPLRGIIRYIGYSLSAIAFFMGYFWILIDDKRQGWHDKLAGTLVIYTWEARHEERFLSDRINQLMEPED
jgi:uncharacterized RDD family membrane protein YckC